MNLITPNELFKLTAIRLHIQKKGKTRYVGTEIKILNKCKSTHRKQTNQSQKYAAYTVYHPRPGQNKMYVQFPADQDQCTFKLTASATIGPN